MTLGLGLVLTLNIISDVDLAIEQRRGDFLSHYKAGRWIELRELAETMRRTLPADAKVVSPHGRSLTWWSGRQASPSWPMPEAASVSPAEAAWGRGVRYAVVLHDASASNGEPIDEGILPPAEQLWAHETAAPGAWRLVRLERQNSAGRDGSTLGFGEVLAEGRLRVLPR